MIHFHAEFERDRVLRMGFEDRKSQAIQITQAVDPKLRGLVFSLLDGKPIRDSIYRMIEPKGN